MHSYMYYITYTTNTLSILGISHCYCRIRSLIRLESFGQTHLTAITSYNRYYETKKLHIAIEPIHA